MKHLNVLKRLQQVCPTFEKHKYVFTIDYLELLCNRIKNGKKRTENYVVEKCINSIKVFDDNNLEFDDNFLVSKEQPKVSFFEDTFQIRLSEENQILQVCNFSQFPKCSSSTLNELIKHLYFLYTNIGFHGQTKFWNLSNCMGLTRFVYNTGFFYKVVKVVQIIGPDRVNGSIIHKPNIVIDKFLSIVKQFQSKDALPLHFETCDLEDSNIYEALPVKIVLKDVKILI